MRRWCVEIAIAVTGAASVLPLAYLVWFVFSVVLILVSRTQPSSADSAITVHVLAIAVSAVTFTGFLLAITFNSRFERQERLQWLVLHCVMWPVAMPAYWWYHIRRRRTLRGPGKIGPRPR